MSISGATLLLGVELVVNRNVQISPVAVVGTAGKLACHLLAGLDGEHIGEVEDGLLPVGVLGVWAGAEADGFVAGGELNVEPGDKSVDVVGAADGEVVWEGECEVGDGACIEVECEDGTGVGDDGLELHGVDEWLSESSELKRGVVEAVDVVPDYEISVSAQKHKSMQGGERTSNLVVLVLAVLNTSHEDGSLVGEDQTLAILAEVSVTSPQHSVQHALVQQEVSHPLRNDDINLWERKLDLLHLALQQGDLVRHSIGLDDLASLVNDGGHVHTNNVLGAGLDGEHAENGSSASNVENDLVFEQMAVVVDGVAV